MNKIALILLLGFIPLSAKAGGDPFYQLKLQIELQSGEIIEGYTGSYEIGLDGFHSITFKSSPYYKAILSQNDTAIFSRIYSSVFYYRDTVNIYSDMIKLKIGNEHEYVYRHVGTRTKIAKNQIQSFNVISIYASSIWGGSITTNLSLVDKQWVEKEQILEERDLITGEICDYKAYFFIPSNENTNALVWEFKRQMLNLNKYWSDKEKQMIYNNKVESLNEELRENHVLILSFCSS